MEQLSIADTNVDWRALVEHVVRDSVVIEIQQGDTTVARISPVLGLLPLDKLNGAIASVPSLGDDAESFGSDLESIRHSMPAEPNRWD
jgi:hypothetical protein